jgi:tetratricopeptide (TPR) repeat protein
VAEHFRIDELRRRVEQDPSSIAFAQLAEALRRTGAIDEAIETCRAGLVHHPTYSSAHVTLGRALIEKGDLEDAETEFKLVLASAPENLAAIRGLAEIHQRRGRQGEALEQFRRALTLAPHDPELEETVSRLAAGLEAPPTPTPPAEPGPDETPAPASAPATTPAPAEASASPAVPPDAPVEAVPAPAAHQIEALGRWLDAILAERERQD